MKKLRLFLLWSFLLYCPVMLASCSLFGAGGMPRDTCCLLAGDYCGQVNASYTYGDTSVCLAMDNGLCDVEFCKSDPASAKDRGKR